MDERGKSKIVRWVTALADACISTDPIQIDDVARAEERSDATADAVVKEM